MTDSKTLIHAIELRKEIAVRNNQAFVDLPYEMVSSVIKLLKEQEKLLGDYEKISQVLFKIDKYFSIKELEWLVNEMDNGRIVVLQDNGHQIGGTTITETTIKIRQY